MWHNADNKEQMLKVNLEIKLLEVIPRFGKLKQKQN